MGLILSDLYPNQTKSDLLAYYINLLSANLYSVGFATLCSKSEVILTSRGPCSNHTCQVKTLILFSKLEKKSEVISAAGA